MAKVWEGVSTGCEVATTYAGWCNPALRDFLNSDLRNGSGENKKDNQETLQFDV